MIPIINYIKRINKVKNSAFAQTIHYLKNNASVQIKNNIFSNKLHLKDKYNIKNKYLDYRI